MASRRVHLANPHGKPLCGVRSPEPLLSSDTEAVTCKNCIAASAPLGPFQKQFFSKVAGVTHDNRDGSSRQSAIDRCYIGEHLILEAEPDNRFDPHAVSVRRENGEQLGYLEARVAADVQPYLLERQTIPCCISALTGGGNLTKGVNIYIGAWESPESTSRSSVRYVDVKQYTFNKPAADYFQKWGLLIFVAILIIVLAIMKSAS